MLVYLQLLTALFNTNMTHECEFVFFFQEEEIDEDIWDDTALIKAYDEAVDLMKVNKFVHNLLNNFIW